MSDNSDDLPSNMYIAAWNKYIVERVEFVVQ